MLRLLVVACLAVAIQGVPHHNPKSTLTKIVGGTPTTIDQVPWQVAIEIIDFYYCGGSIISANYILTSAFCVYQALPKDIKIRSGTSKFQSGGTVTKVASITLNPNYEYLEDDYNVAVLKLSEPLTLGENQQAVSLRKKEASANETAQITGWGITEESGRPPVDLQVVQLPVVARDECNAIYDGKVTELMICAGTAGKNSCEGDYGGALTIDNVQVGIVSRASLCLQEKYPGIYSNIAALADFINENSNNEATWA